MKDFFRNILKVIVKGAIYTYCKIVYRMKIIGKENIPKEGPLIICGNHRSFLDPPLIEVTCGRDARFLAKEELTKNKFLAFLGFVFDVILVRRDSKEVKALKDSVGISGGEKPFKKVYIKYGKPLDFSEYKNSKDKETLDKITDEIMSSILSLTK